MMIISTELSYPWAFPHQRKICLLRQIFCRHKHFTSTDGLSLLDKFWPKRTNLQSHRRQNLSPVKTGQNWLDIQNCDKLVNRLS